MHPIPAPSTEDTAAHLAVMADACQARFPDDAPRIAAARTLVAAGMVTAPVAGTVYAVDSRTATRRRYDATAYSCNCADSTYRSRRCVHQWGVILASALDHQQRFDRLVAEHQPIHYEVTPKGRAAAQR